MDSDIHGVNRGVFQHDDVVASYAETMDLTLDEEIHFGRWIPFGARILDLGVGTGRTTQSLMHRASYYVGIDYAPAMIESARQAFPRADLRVCDASDLGQFEDASFDAAVFSYNGIDCLHPERRRYSCLAEVRRVVRDGGVFIFTSHNPRAIMDRVGDYHLTRRIAARTIVAYRRAKRLLPTRAFIAGEGYVREPADGGLTLHMGTVRCISSELDRSGFVLVDILTGRSDRRRPSVISPWYSYVAIAVVGGSVSGRRSPG